MKESDDDQEKSSQDGAPKCKVAQPWLRSALEGGNKNEAFEMSATDAISEYNKSDVTTPEHKEADSTSDSALSSSQQLERSITESPDELLKRLDKQPRKKLFMGDFAFDFAAAEEEAAAKNRCGAGEDVFGADFEISWHELSYVVESKWYKLTRQRKPILDKLSGSFKSGQLTAVLGPSGAGKSTLIDCILGKRGTRGVSGRTQVNFRAAPRRLLKIATIPQADHLLGTLTVSETLMFASRIKNAHLTGGSSTTSNQKPFNHAANVQRVIQQLNLGSCAGLKCAKLSGGQYKRVSIAQELLSRPDLMILDEPTSGLDSVTCYQTICALRHLIESTGYPIAIVATIHQPDLETINLFHKAYVLASGGRAIYEGPVADICPSIEVALQLVESRRLAGEQSSNNNNNNNQHKIELRQQILGNQATLNPAKLIVQVAAQEHGFDLTSALADIQVAKRSGGLTSGSPEGSSTHLAHTSFNSQETLAVGGLVASSQAQLHPLASEPPTKLQPPSFNYADHEPRNRRANLDPLLDLKLAGANQRRSFRAWWRHLGLHTYRSWLTIIRDPMLFTVQIALHIFVPLLISYAFSGQTRTDACPRVGPMDVVEEAFRPTDGLGELNNELRKSIENLGYVFFQLYVIIFAAVCVTSLTYPLAMHVLLKEYRNGWYSLSSYFLGRTLADLPVPSVNVAMAMAISYHLTGQPVDAYNWRFLSIALLTVLATLVAQTMGLMFGALLMDAPQSAVFVAPASTAPLVVVCGFLLRIKSLPLLLQYLSKLSYFTHLINGVIISRYGFNRCPCQESDFSIDERHVIPNQARATIDLWLESFAVDYNATDSSSPQGFQVDLVGKLMNALERARTFNHKIESCDQVRPFVMLDYDLEDSHLFECFAALALMLVAFRWLTYTSLLWKINTSI